MPSITVPPAPTGDGTQPESLRSPLPESLSSPQPQASTRQESTRSEMSRTSSGFFGRGSVCLDDWNEDDADDNWQPGDMSITLEPEFYTAAFVSPLHLHQQRHTYERVCGESFFTLGMLAVACMQCLTVFGMSSYLTEKDSGYMDEFKLGTGLFATGGATMTVDHARDLCGNFNHIGLKNFAGTDSIRMPDGTTFAGTSAMPMFHSYKMPSGSWVFTSIGGDESYVDKQLRVVHGSNLRDSMSYFRHFRVEYGVLFVIMVGWLWYHVLYELRKILKFSFVLNHFYGKGLVRDSNETTYLDKETGAITITHLTWNAFLVGYLCVVMRITVVLMMLVWGTSLLAASWNKLSLVLNSLAIGIVFELDVIIAYAVIDHNTMQRIESIEPVTTVHPPQWRSFRYMIDIVVSGVLLLGVFLAALTIRYWQVDTHMHQLHNAAALCLFAGPPPQAHPEVLAPVPGFCESLLSMTCSPNVTGPGSHHGPCLITDQNVFKDRSIVLYGDDEVFENMYDEKGRRKSMSQWGQPKEKLLNSNTWQEDRQLNLFRRICTQLYHPEGAIDKRIIDPNVGLEMYSAPFYCPRNQIFQAIFGNVQHDFDNWSAALDLSADSVVSALDGCREPQRKPESSASKVPSGPAPAPAVVPAPAPAPAVVPVPGSTNLLRASRHRAHHEVYHYSLQAST